MGFGGISIWQLLIILAIVILLFGTKRLRNFGSDLGNAVKGFRKSMDNEEDTEKPTAKIEQDTNVVDSTVEKKEQHDTSKTNDNK